MMGIVSRRASRFAELVLPALFLPGCFGEPPEPLPEGFCAPINFEQVCGPFDFVGAGTEPGFEGGVSLIVDNPDRGGLNDSAKVVQMQKFRAESGLTFGGSTLQRPDGVDFSRGEAVTMLVWATREVPVTFKFEGLEQERVVSHSGSGGWEELCFDFTGTTDGPPVTGITFIFDANVLGDAAANPGDWTFYYDEIAHVESCGGAGGTPP